MEKWGGKLPRFKHDVLRDGDEEYPDKPEYEGMMFIAAKSDRRPEIVDANRDEIMSDDEFYSGCWGRASVNFYPYTVETNKGVACGLGNLQKTKDDTPIRRRRPPRRWTSATMTTTQIWINQKPSLSLPTPQDIKSPAGF